MTENLPALLDVPAAAARLGVPVSFVRRLVHERRVPFVKVGRLVRFDPADLEAFIAAARTEARP
ncbi:MAG TPA: helix-turn-helix domain-containing protein [Roseomonas sp.]|jgi:excisionase family DNA binding protein